MAYSKVQIQTEIYNLTSRDNIWNILSERCIRRFDEIMCCVCCTQENVSRYMVLCERKPYFATGGVIKHYLKFVPEDYLEINHAPAM